MAKIKFITDSASDISEAYEKKYDILIMNFKVAMGDKSYTSRVDFDNNKFYKMLDAYDGVPVSSRPIKSSTRKAIPISSLPPSAPKAPPHTITPLWQ